MRDKQWNGVVKAAKIEMGGMSPSEFCLRSHGITIVLRLLRLSHEWCMSVSKTSQSSPLISVHAGPETHNEIHRKSNNLIAAKCAVSMRCMQRYNQALCKGV